MIQTNLRCYYRASKSLNKVNQQGPSVGTRQRAALFAALGKGTGSVFYRYDSEDHEKKATEVLARLGEFIIYFERVCAGMRSCIHCAFRRSGLQNHGLSQVVINKLAAEGLRTTLGAVFQELPDQDDDDKKIVRDVLARIDRLGSIRNELLHAEWFFNYEYEEAGDEFYALALKSNSSQNSGANSLKISVTKESLNQHIKESTEIQIFLTRLATCLNEKGLKVSEALSKPL